jgi:hypothetical protein
VWVLKIFVTFMSVIPTAHQTVSRSLYVLSLRINENDCIYFKYLSFNENLDTINGNNLLIPDKFVWRPVGTVDHRKYKVLK